MAMPLAHSAKDGIPVQPYREHIAEVCRLAMKNAEKAAAFATCGSLLLETVKYAAAFHDLGKLDEENQKVLRGERTGALPIKHWDAGVAHLLDNKRFWANFVAAFLIASHHQGLLSWPDERVRGVNVFRDTAALQRTNSNLNAYLIRHQSEIGHIDASGIELKNKSAHPLFMRFALSCLVDGDHSDTARNYDNSVPEDAVPLLAEERLAALDRYVVSLSDDESAKKERNEMRQRVYDACRTAAPEPSGLIACDSPVGTGKTTAVMAHLLNVAAKKGLRRIFVVLPFTNIIDQSVEVYRSSFVLSGENREKVVASHHHRVEFEEEANRAYSFLWNAPITVTTAVQFFETLASNHPASLRKLHQLAGSAIFFDEAHAALPAHLWPQAWKWLHELVKDWGCYIVMASGSLTRFWELEEFAEEQEHLPELVATDVRDASMESEKQRIAYRLKGDPLDIDELCDWIQQLPGPRLVILNTVQSAAVVAKELAKRQGRANVEHLSTALASLHRKTTIDRVKSRLGDSTDSDWTLVATSCVEAGVDFSFRSAARELCSLVSTIQTAGRANRSGEFGTSELWGFHIKPGALLREHPGFSVSAAVLSKLYEQKMIAPEFCKEAMRREVRERNQGTVRDDIIVRAEHSRKFPEVNDLFKVIGSNMLTVIIDVDLRQRLERHERVAPSELQQKAVSIYTSKSLQYGVAPIIGFDNLYVWTLAYDDFLGYMAGVLKLANPADNFIV